MKNVKKTILVVTAVCLLLFSLTSCIKSETAKETINGFFKAVSEENYSNAASHMHPDIKDDLKTYFEEIENKNGVDFSKGVKIERYTSVRTAYYDSKVGGALYETAFSADIDGKSAVVSVMLVDNDSGYGIYWLDISFCEL